MFNLMSFLLQFKAETIVDVKFHPRTCTKKGPYNSDFISDTVQIFYVTITNENIFNNLAKIPDNFHS